MIIYVFLIGLAFYFYGRNWSCLSALSGATALTFAGVWIFTESAGVLGCLTVSGAWGFWGGACIGLGVLFWRNRGSMHFRKLDNISESFRVHRWYWLGLGSLLLAEFSVGWLIPTSNYDSMSYHMARIMHWLSQGHVGFFDTFIERQNFQMPFGEFFLANLILLHGGSDLAVNSLQFFSLIACLIILYGLIRRFGGNDRAGRLGIMLGATAPMAVCQSTTTQNDLLCSLLLLLSLYYIISFIRDGKTVNMAGLGIIVGLSLLTKGVMYVVLLPFLLTLTVCCLRKRSWRIMAMLFGAALIALSVNIPHLTRNQQYYHSIWGPDSGTYLNCSGNIRLTGINIIRHVATGLTMPLNPVNRILTAALEKMIGPDLSHPLITLPAGFRFRMYWGFSEDAIPNTPQMLIFLTMLPLAYFVAWRRKMIAADVLLWLGTVLGSMLLFGVVLCWQPWISRLHLPLIMTGVIFSALVWERFLPEWLLRGLMLLLWIIAGTTLAVNHYCLVRDLWPRGILYPYKERDAVRFVSDRNALTVYRDYWRAAQLLTGASGAIGLICGSDDMEYPLWVIYRRQTGHYPKLIPLSGKNLEFKPEFICRLRRPPAEVPDHDLSDYETVLDSERIQLYRRLVERPELLRQN